MKERNHAFDLLCGICIVRMVTLHIMTMCGKNDASWWVEIMYWSYFFMSFFFFPPIVPSLALRVPSKVPSFAVRTP